MKKNSPNLPTTEELRFRAKTMAYRIAEADDIDPNTVRRMTDTLYDKQCFVVSEDETLAVIVYDHDPYTKFHIMNRPGRLQPLTTEQKEP